ncbi:hypothetical protein FQN57_001274 [Myotisia sp. PD_48]|nr:hypothetical protein FQN57_001274 [Myotisia sp. PD_48]
MAVLLSGSICLSILFLFYKYLIAPAVVSPLSKLPNAHFTSPVFPFWIWWKKRKGQLNRTTLALHQKFGPVVRLGPNEVSVNSAEGLRTIYTSRGGFIKTTWYQELFQNFGVENLVSMQEHKPHAAQKRVMAHIYSKSYLMDSQDLHAISNTVILDRLLPVLEKAASKHAKVEVLSLGKAVGMDFTSAYLFGLANGTNFVVEQEYRNKWLGKYEIFKYQQPQDRILGDVEQWCLDLCKLAESSSTADGDTGTRPVVHELLWNHLQSHRPAASENRLKVASEMLDHLVAGHETSGVTLTYLMYELSRHPDLMAELRQELGQLNPSLYRAKLDPAQITGVPSPAVLDALPFLDALIRETLRVYAAASAPQPRLTPASKQVMIHGYVIPGGVTVSSSAYTLHRNPAVFPNPLDWSPTRWLRADKQQLEEMNRWYWPFGSGGRMCLGSHFAIQSK